MKYTSSNLDYIIQELRKVDLTQPKRITITDWKTKRSISANRVYQGWYPLIADAMAMAMTIPEATRYVKLTFGLQILLADEYMGNLIGEGLAAKGFFNLDYESQLAEMERLPVTRLFDTEMHNNLRHQLQMYYGAMGVNLEYR